MQVRVTAKVPADPYVCEVIAPLAVVPSPKSQALLVIAGPPFADEVLVKLTGTPAQTLRGKALKLAIGFWARSTKEQQAKKINKILLML